MFACIFHASQASYQIVLLPYRVYVCLLIVHIARTQFSLGLYTFDVSLIFARVLDAGKCYLEAELYHIW